MRWVLLVLCLSGCAETQTQLDDARSYVKSGGEELLRLHGILSAVCVAPEPAYCPELKASFDRLQTFYTKLNENIP